jgi:ubiquitin-protein ligase
MATVAVKRILSDIRKLQASNLERDGIFFQYNESNIMNIKALIIGPSETVYENGYYFFDLKFSELYPMEPPKVTFCTLDGHVRFNPNLYANGKVCLSIINTWDGPKWTPCQSISSILLSIQAMIFVKDPLCNEPCYYECKDRNVLDPYNRGIEYENYRVAMIKMLKTIPQGFEGFYGIIREHFMKNYEKILKRVQELSQTVSPQIINLHYYNMKSHVNYNELFVDFQELVGTLLTMDDIPPIPEESNAVFQPQPHPINIAEILQTPPVTNVGNVGPSGPPIIINNDDKSQNQSSILSNHIKAVTSPKKNMVAIKFNTRMKVGELRELCVSVGISVDGKTKPKLIESLQQYNVTVFDNVVAGIKNGTV